MASNKVIAGDHQGIYVSMKLNRPYLWIKKEEAGRGMFELYINYENVASYEVVDESSRKSALSAVGRAAVGAALLGPVGLLAGVTAKPKGTHTIAIYWKDGKQSLCEVDDKIKKAIVTQMF